MKGNFYDRSYYEKHGADEGIHRVSKTAMKESIFYRSLVCPGKGEKLLDVGCGTGSYLSILKDTGADIWGVDISENALQLAKERVEKPEQIICANIVSSLPFGDEEFDHVTAWGVVEHFPSIPVILKEIARVAKKKGTIAIMVPNVYYYKFIYDAFRKGAGPVKHQETEVLYSFKEWKDLIEASGLSVIKVDRHNKFNKSPFVIWLHRVLVPFYFSNHFVFICKK